MFTKYSKPTTSLGANRGFSLVEMMVVLAIMGVVAVGVTAWLTNTNKSAQNISQKGELNSLVNEMQGIFNNTQSCQTAFLNQPPLSPAAIATRGTLATPIPVSMTFGSTTYQAGTTYSSSLQIESLNFTGLNTASAGQYYLQLELKAKRVGATGAALATRTFNVILGLDSAGKIIACSGQYDNPWVRDPIGDGIRYNGTVYATAYMYISDARLKEHVREIPSALERVLSLHGVKYDWKGRRHLTNGTDQFGLLAQEVEKVFPEAVNTNPETGVKSVAYGNLIAPVIEALKEQQALVVKQQQEIAEIKKALGRN